MEERGEETGGDGRMSDTEREKGEDGRVRGEMNSTYMGSNHQQDSALLGYNQRRH